MMIRKKSETVVSEVRQNKQNSNLKKHIILEFLVGLCKNVHVADGEFYVIKFLVSHEIFFEKNYKEYYSMEEKNAGN